MLDYLRIGTPCLKNQSYYVSWYYDIRRLKGEGPLADPRGRRPIRWAAARPERPRGQGARPRDRPRGHPRGILDECCWGAQPACFVSNEAPKAATELSLGVSNASRRVLSIPRGPDAETALFLYVLLEVSNLGLRVYGPKKRKTPPRQLHELPVGEPHCEIHQIILTTWSRGYILLNCVFGLEPSRTNLFCSWSLQQSSGYQMLEVNYIGKTVFALGPRFLKAL